MARTWRKGALGLALVALAACGGDGNGGGEDYPPAVRDQFIQSCTGSGGTNEQCTCALDRLEDEFTLEEFTEESVKFAQGEPSDEFREAVVNATLECQGEGQ